jgi:hypothetical protein
MAVKYNLKKVKNFMKNQEKFLEIINQYLSKMTNESQKSYRLFNF